MVLRVGRLEEELRAIHASALGRSLLSKTPRIPFGTTFTGPTGTRYVLRRVAAGGASFVPQPAAESTWSEA